MTGFAIAKKIHHCGLKNKHFFDENPKLLNSIISRRIRKAGFPDSPVNVNPGVDATPGFFYGSYY
jgi:hypothetical protein